jgi:putative glycosyltransferase (TIGR04372 family)
MKNHIKFTQTFYKIKNWVLHFTLTSMVNFINIAVNRNFRRPETYYARYLVGLNLLPKIGDNHFEWYANWNKTDRMFNKGEYHNAVKIRKEIMYEIYKKNGITDCDYFPPILSKCFSGPIGHNRDIGIHIAAQNLGLLPTGQRYLQVPKKDLNKPFHLSIKDNIKLLSFSDLYSDDEPPGWWHIYERMQLIKTRDGFMDHYELMEKVYIQSAMNPEKSILKLNSDYAYKSMIELRNYGLNESDWFVSLHVRETGNQEELNNQSIYTYIKSIEYIINLGGKVIRIGDSSMPSLPHIKGLIDLSQNSSNSSHLHLYALAAAKFFIGTQSGPKAIPSLFNIPSLITNSTMLGLETLRCSEETIYLPKKTFLNGRLLSFVDIINSPIGYASFNPKDIKEAMIFFESNSSDQILNGVKEMVDIVLNNSPLRNLNLDNKVNEAREQVRFATTGFFSTQWLEESQGWFLANT